MIVNNSFPLLGRARRDALMRLIKGRLDSWSGEWIAPSSRVSVEAVELVRHKPEDVVTLDVDSFLSWSEKDGRKAFAALLLDCAPGDLGGTDERTLADPLVEAALSDLLRVLLHEDPAPNVVERMFGAGLRSDAEGEKRNYLVFRCVIGGLECSLTLPTEPFAEQLAFPALAEHRLSLQPATNALDNQRLRGHVSLGYAELTLGDVAQLSVGDVIRLDVSLDASANLFIDNTSRQFRGQLGLQGNRIAIQIKNVAE